MGEKKYRPTELILWQKIKKLFKRVNKVKKGYIGVYHDTVAFSTSQESLHTIKYDIFVKIRALEVFDNLVEIEILDTHISESVNQDVLNIINTSLPKYIAPKHIKWQINEED